MIVTAFFYLLCSGDYTAAASDTSPFTSDDVQLFMGATRICLITTPGAILLQATFATLELTTQKNGIRGEVIGLGRSGSPLLCPVISIASWIIHLRQHSAPSATPLSHYFHNNQWNHVRPADITRTIKTGVGIFGNTIGFLSKDVFIRSLRAAGAMALLCTIIDNDHIKLIGCWRSDEMLRYLHMQAAPVIQYYAHAMVTAGDFSLIPNRHVENLQVPLH